MRLTHRLRIVISYPAMAIKTEKELNETQRGHWLKAVAAIELRNFGYAISLLQGILKQEPQFLTGRQLLRRTEVTKSKLTKKSFFNFSTAPITVMKAQREIKRDPKHAVEMLEKVLEEGPYHRQANLVLKEAAVAAGRDQRARDAALAMQEYRAERIAAEAKTERLRALRLARDALAKEAESSAKKKPAKKKTSKAAAEKPSAR